MAYVLLKVNPLTNEVTRMASQLDFEIVKASEYDHMVNWEGVMRKNERRLQGFIRKRVSNYADVDDLMQSTWLEVLRNKNKFCGDSKPETWMFGIAINLVKNYYKTLKVSYLHDDIDDEIAASLLIHSDRPDWAIEDNDTLIKALERIRKFPAEHQQVLQLIVLDDHSYQSVADELQVPVGTVRSRLSRLRQTLKKELEIGEC